MLHYKVMSQNVPKWAKKCMHNFVHFGTFPTITRLCIMICNSNFSDRLRKIWATSWHQNLHFDGGHQTWSGHGPLSISTQAGKMYCFTDGIVCITLPPHKLQPILYFSIAIFIPWEVLWIHIFCLWMLWPCPHKMNSPFDIWSCSSLLGALLWSFCRHADSILWCK